MDSQLQAIIDEPVPSFSQAAYLQSPPEKKRSKKARGETSAESPVRSATHAIVMLKLKKGCEAW